MTVPQAADEPTLGIIGGAGVGAAARLYADVCALVRADSGRLPRIALWNVPLSDALEHAFTAAEPDPQATAAAAAMVGEAVDRLLAAGATVIAMPCNSLQRAAAREARRARVPFIDMIAATVGAARESGAERAVLVATESTLAGGVYEDYGIEVLAPTDATRATAATLIARAVAGALPGADEMRALVAGAHRPGAAVILGCTDICGLLEPGDAAAADVIESLGCLAARCAEALRAPQAVA